jgi:hypothetical protein
VRPQPKSFECAWSCLDSTPSTKCDAAHYCFIGATETMNVFIFPDLYRCVCCMFGLLTDISQNKLLCVLAGWHRMGNKYCAALAIQRKQSADIAPYPCASAAIPELQRPACLPGLVHGAQARPKSTPLEAMCSHHAPALQLPNP